jgi:hypothetical protein
MTGYGESRTVGGRTQSDSGDMPRPLHVTKRSALEGRNRIPRNARGCSPASDQSDATMDSPPEPPGGSRPLTLPKKRGGRGGWAMYDPVGCTWSRDRDGRTADGGNPTSIKPCLGCILLTPARDSSFTVGWFCRCPTSTIRIMHSFSSAERPFPLSLPAVHWVQEYANRAESDLGWECQPRKHTRRGEPNGPGYSGGRPGREFAARECEEHVSPVTLVRFRRQCKNLAFTGADRPRKPSRPTLPVPSGTLCACSPDCGDTRVQSCR